MSEGTFITDRGGVEQGASSRSLDAVEEEIAALASHIHAATYRLLELIRELDARGGWEGFRSCAHWINWRIGLDLGAAREKVRVAKALPALPQIAEAFRRGTLSYSKVRAVSRVATPENEAALLAIAEAGTASHVEQVVRAYRRSNRAEALAEANRQHAERYLRYYHDDDGMLVIEGRLPAESGALVVQALEAAADALLKEQGDSSTAQPASIHDIEAQVSAEVLGEHAQVGAADVSAEVSSREVAPKPTSSMAPGAGENPGGYVGYGMRRVDALARLAQVALAAEAVEGHGGDRHLVVIHVDADSLAEDGVATWGGLAVSGSVADPNGGGRCEVEQGPGIAAETARRVSCDCGVVRIVEDRHGQPLDVGRKTRSIPPALRRALRARDGGCRFPGCTAHRFVEGHHVKHWADGGETKLSNTLFLCGFHHRLVHEGGYRVALGADGEARFWRPDDRPLAQVPALPEASLCDGRDGRFAWPEGVQVPPVPRDGGALGLWRGERFDLDTALSVS